MPTAIATTSFTLGDRNIVAGAVLRDMPAGQLADLKSVGLVREATDEEIAADERAAAAPLAPALLDPPTPGMTVEQYVDAYLAGEGRDDPAMQQFAANHSTEIEAAFAARKAAEAAPAA